MILGVTGTNGAGKGAVVEYLEEKGFAHYSVRALLIEEVEKRGLALDRAALGSVGTELRQARGPAFFVDTFLARAQEAGAEDVVIESIRALAEAEGVRTHGGFIIGVDAPLPLRYERIVGRGSETDKVTLEQFREQEDREYTPKDPADPTQMNVLGVLAAADYTIMNDGTLEELHANIDRMVKELATR